MSNLQKLKEIKAKKLEILRKKQRYIKDNRIFYFNRPNPLQAEIIRAWEDPTYKIFTMTGANRIGKTTMATILAFSVMFGFWPWNGKKIIFPHDEPRKVRYVGQEWETHVKTVILPALYEWWPKSRKLKHEKNQQGIEATWIDVETGSSLQIMTNCQKTIAHEGWWGDLVLYDEPPERDKRVANMRGLVDRCGREFFAMTLLDSGWVDREVIHLKDKLGRPDPSVFSVNGEIEVNVGYGLTTEGVEQFMKGLTEEELDARIHGIPAYMASKICPNFNRKTHLVDRFEIPTDWPITVAIDVHPKERQAVLFLACAPNGNRYVCDEMWFHGDGTDVGEAIMRRAHRNCYRLDRIVIDPLAKSDDNNPNTTFGKIEDVLFKYGYILETATKDKESGILEINKGLMGPNKIPSLFIFRDLVRTIMEMEGWMYDDKKVPIKEDDHMMENLYRILLLDPQYYDEEEEEVVENDEDRGPTGY